MRLLLFMLMTSFAWAENHVIKMKSISFEPKKIEIKAGDSLEWRNVSYTEHSATADDGSFESGMIPPKKESKKIAFSKPGAYSYHCSLHGKSMSAQVVVTP